MLLIVKNNLTFDDQIKNFHDQFPIAHDHILNFLDQF